MFYYVGIQNSFIGAFFEGGGGLILWYFNQSQPKIHFLSAIHSFTQCICIYNRTQAFKHGGRPDAKKVMIVITDGESHDSPDLKKAVEESEKDNITLYGIAVSYCFFSVKSSRCVLQVYFGPSVM